MSFPTVLLGVQGVPGFSLRAWTRSHALALARVHAGNAASMRILEKHGFVCEGTQRLSAFKAGRVSDRVIWATYREPEMAPPPSS